MPHHEPDSRDLAHALRATGIRDVLDAPVDTAAYSSDASLYRVRPAAVVRPHDHDEVAATLAVARSLETAVTARGGGTSIAGNAIGPGIVVDFSRHMNRVLDLDPVARTARVQPGTVLDVLQSAADPHRLRFGPDPSTASRCTIGGMIGNDSCGSRSVAHGRTADNVRGLRFLTASGETVNTRRTADGPTHRGFETGRAALTDLVRSDLAAIRTELGRFPRQISGYALHRLLPEHGFDLTGFVVGSEGTLGIVTEAEVDLTPVPRERVLTVLGFSGFAEAGDTVPAILAHRVTACEGLDRRIVDMVRARIGSGWVPPLPRGDAWLLVELSGDDRTDLHARARALVEDVAPVDHVLLSDPADAARMWKIRADGAGLAGRAPSGKPAWAGWEDAAVPPEHLGTYLRDFERLLDHHGLTAMPYGHFGEGCIHVRLDFDLVTGDGRARFRTFLEEAAACVVGYGGSLSGEHGDGRARSELLPALYSPAVLDLFARVKSIFDPTGLLNPNVLVTPARLDDDLRLAVSRPPRGELAFGYRKDGGDLAQAVHRCTGVGSCRAPHHGPGQVMCPSYRATRNERDSTRGRSRLLQELMRGDLSDGWRSAELHQALDLCLACKGCASDCPSGVDMATYKAEVLHQGYRGRLRPRSHYTLGRLPQWLRLGRRIPRLLNQLLRFAPARRLALSAAGADPRRGVPPFAPQTLRSWYRSRPAPSTPGSATTRAVVVFVDSFTDTFTPEAGQATIRLLESAGFQPLLSSPSACCALTWISTGQLDHARERLGSTVDLLLPHALAGTPIVGIEPSCTAVLRRDAVELLGTQAARDVALATRTVAELLSSMDWEPPNLTGTTVLAQPHCHHHAVMGWEADAALLARSGAEVVQVGGCCGLAGNFGMERGHYDLSVQVAELELLPAVRSLPEDAIVLADGFSCRTQLRDLADRPAVHLTQLLQAATTRTGA